MNKRRMRDFIVSTFEMVCLVIVVLPTVFCLFIALISEEPIRLIIFAAIIFVVSAFLAGGALTVISIAENTSETVRLLKQIDTALHSISKDSKLAEELGEIVAIEAAGNASPPNA